MFAGSQWLIPAFHNKARAAGVDSPAEGVCVGVGGGVRARKGGRVGRHVAAVSVRSRTPLCFLLGS